MIRHSSAMEAFAAAASSMASDGHVVDIVATLLFDCTSILPATSAAIMVKQANGHLALLHSTSHRASEIEMLQIQSAQGPCVDSIVDNVLVSESGAEAIIARWHDVGAAIVDAGYSAVASVPMRWHDEVLGGLNIFRSDPQPISEAESLVAQGFANMATLALVRPTDIPLERLTARVAEALQARSTIEQAKGVLAHLHGVEPGEAYELLVERVTGDGQSITAVAEDIVRAQHS
jgi:GAF domain-containing protein